MLMKFGVAFEGYDLWILHIDGMDIITILFSHLMSNKIPIVP